MPWRHETGELATEHVRDAGDQRRKESEPPCPQEAVREATSEKDVEDEAPGQTGIRREDESEQRRGIEDVPMHGGDVRQSAEEVGIPLGNPLPRFQRLAGEVAHRPSSDVLVAVRVD